MGGGSHWQAPETQSRQGHVPTYPSWEVAHCGLRTRAPLPVMEAFEFTAPWDLLIGREMTKGGMSEWNDLDDTLGREHDLLGNSVCCPV